MDLIPNEWKHKIRDENSQNPFVLTTKVLGKYRAFKIFPIKKFTSPLNLITLNATSLLSLFHGQTL